MGDKAALPTGTVTFLLTDIEGSTRLWEQHPEAMRQALARHDTLAAAVIERHAGTLVKSRGEGDSLFAVFAEAPDALAAAHSLQRAFTSEPWPAETPLCVRIALHTGEADLRDSDYYGSVVNRCARLRAAGHGGQVLLSQATVDAAQDALPEAVTLRDLGAHRLKDLQQPERLFQLVAPSLPAEFPALRSLEAFAHNLPRQLTSFIGREREMAEVKRLLGTTALLTLTGAGGCGKTRLALQVAADLVEEFADGVWLVELAALVDPALAAQTAASTLGVREEPGRPLESTLTDYLRNRSVLMILDNCEHLLSACAHLADRLLRACPKLRILASSREGLGIAGETTYRLPTLSVPDLGQMAPTPQSISGCESVRLFVDRASSAAPGFRITNENAPAVARVCHRLDGIPLAVELAAARVRALPVEKIDERLDDRFRLLTGGSRTALPRQQTLRATIDWSYDLLSEAERTLLRRLSVFAGGWTLEAAEAVISDECSVTSDESRPAFARHSTLDTRHFLRPDDVLDLLTSLVDKSLVLYGERDAAARYGLLETVRQYGWERLVEARETEWMRRRHTEVFVASAEEAQPRLRSAEQAVWLERLECEHDNLRAALVWCIDSETADVGLRLGAAMHFLWRVRGYHTEGREHLRRLLTLAGALDPTSARGHALRAAGNLAGEQGDSEAARALLEEAFETLQAAGDATGVANTQKSLGDVALDRGDYELAGTLYEQALATFRELGARHGVAGAVHDLGLVAAGRGDHARACALFEESLAVFRELGLKRGILLALGSLGYEAYLQGEYGTARSRLEESLALGRELGAKPNLATTLHMLGCVEREQGHFEQARALLRESLTLCCELGTNRAKIAERLVHLGALAAAAGWPTRGARLSGAAAAILESTDVFVSSSDDPTQGRWGAVMREVLGEEAFAAAWAEGRALSLDEAIAYALEDASPEAAK